MIVHRPPNPPGTPKWTLTNGVLRRVIGPTVTPTVAVLRPERLN